MIRITTIIKFFLIVCCGCFIAIANADDRYWLMWLLPVVYGFVLIIIDLTAGKKSKEVGYRVIKIVMLFRYVITPVSVVLSQYYTGPGPEPSQSSMTLAIVLMIYELVFVGSAIAFYSLTNKADNNDVKIDIKSEKNNLIWLYIIISFIIISLVDIRLILPTNMLIITNDFETVSLNAEGSGLLIILRSTLRILLGIALLNSINRMKITDKTKVILSIISIILILSLYTSNGRWDTLSVSFVGIILLIKLYPKYSKTISISIGSIMLAALTSVTIYKFLGHTTTSVSYLTITKEIVEVVSKQFQVYFSGPRNVALAIDMGKNVDIKWTWLINDILGSFPGLSQFFDQNIRFNLLYNSYIYSGDIVSQIIPLVGIGYNIFGFLLSPIITVGFIILVLKLNDLYKSKKNISDRYLLLYMIIFTSMCMGMSIQILVNKYYAVFIPTIIILFFSKWIVRLFANSKIYITNH